MESDFIPWQRHCRMTANANKRKMANRCVMSPPTSQTNGFFSPTPSIYNFFAGWILVRVSLLTRGQGRDLATFGGKTSGGRNRSFVDLLGFLATRSRRKLEFIPKVFRFPLVYWYISYLILVQTDRARKSVFTGRWFVRRTISRK